MSLDSRRQPPPVAGLGGGARNGVVVLCSPYDWLFAKGCLASLHWFMPEVPVCLLVDGPVDVSAAKAAYALEVLRREDVPDEWLRHNSFGWGVSKMAAIWHAPFDRYLYLDADTVVWGDLRAKAFEGQQDVVWPASAAPQGDLRAYVNTWFFNPGEVEQLWPGFLWTRFVASFACTGTFVLRRGCLGLERYKQLMLLGKSNPNLFRFGEMGLLNLMVFERVQEGSLSLRQADLQTIFPDHTQPALKERFHFDARQKPLVRPGDEQVLHMPDKKPLMDNPGCYSAPMTHFRLQFLADTEKLSGPEALRRLQAEDQEYHRLRAQFLRRERNRKILGLFKGDLGAWRRLLGKLGRAQ